MRPRSSRQFGFRLGMLIALLGLAACGGTAGPVPTPAGSTVRSGEGPPACSSVGQSWVRPADGMVLLCVPAGEFTMGSAESDPAAVAQEKPAHRVTLDAFWIDRVEVTNAQYRRCVEAGACAGAGCWDNSNLNAPDQPVVCVSWQDSQSYCAWAGGRLPTEAEWEKAARGTDGRAYPWGSVFDGSRLNYCDDRCKRDWRDGSYDDGYAYTAPVGSYPAGASPYGALDMAGNVAEWTGDWFAEYPGVAEVNPAGPEMGYCRVLRGGSWFYPRQDARTASRDHLGAEAYWEIGGFRCIVPGR